MKYLIISCSLNPGSKSRILANTVLKEMHKEEVELIDLKEYKLPFCDGDSCYDNENVKILKNKIEEASGIIIATPIYNFDVNAVAKNLIELTGKSWQNKVVAFLCAAGGGSSYMAPMQLANSLMLDFRTFIVPRFVYTNGNAFENNQISDPVITERINSFVKDLIRVTKALSD